MALDQTDDIQEINTSNICENSNYACNQLADVFTRTRAIEEKACQSLHDIKISDVKTNHSTANP